MKKHGQLLLVLLISFLIIFLFPSFLGASPTTENKEIDISTSPHKVFFNLQNIKPGDHSTKEMTISNNGEQDFIYIFSQRFLNGSTKLYDEILLKVNDADGTLFDGKLKDFEKLEGRELKSGESEVLIFEVEMPYELGNEFQGLATEFQFKVYVEGTLGGILPVDNKLPDTASNMYNYLLLGVALLLGGGSLYYFQRRKKLALKKD
ncbi:LPXTG cell wall anchor domain-containing protein [Salinibacillus xinjiangensis]|uniref:LPXTG cell wall anchor domain-containing protein n=1 Tax=Salinibacillus xinjiangensis TaxID=1229268 RepID=A0A6G1X263_9BACI|nr:LPXTG cell wall anchor domain-containing protein [Salinibacillus xinjiangensis]MRG85024.1 LPXTG cell wall anchor domain-containing protein [Salinibacillus xinjiangensis]